MHKSMESVNELVHCALCMLRVCAIFIVTIYEITYYIDVRGNYLGSPGGTISNAIELKSDQWADHARTTDLSSVLFSK